MDEENYVFVEVTGHPNTVLEGLNHLRLSNDLCDVVLCCGGREFPCHRVVLASCSSYFQAMFTTGMLESTQDRVELHGVEPHIIDLLLTYAYTSEVYIPKEHVQELVAAAHMLDIKAVLQECCFYMSRHIDKSNCLGINSFAEAHSLEELQEKSLAYIIKHFRHVYLQEEFSSLSVDTVTKILSNEDLNAPKEEMVFEAAMSWLNKSPTRRQHFEKFLGLTHLPLISPSYLHDEVESLEMVKESQHCQMIISEAKAKNQHLLPYCNTAHPRRTREVIVMVGGRSDGKLLCSAECLDPVGQYFTMRLPGPWKILACLPFDVHKHGLAVLGTALYVAGGELPNGSVSKEMWRIDHSHEDSWIKMAPMNEARSEFGLVMLDGYLWAVGGQKHPGCPVERYDPNTNTWQLMESVGLTGWSKNPAVVALDGLIYVLGRKKAYPIFKAGSPGTDIAIAYKYNPETSVWTEVAPMQVPRSASAACTLNGKIYVIGGEHSSVTTDKVECYDPKTDQWAMRASMETRRRHSGVVVMAGKIYVLGGLDYSGGNLRTIEKYCDQTDTWERAGELSDNRIYEYCERTGRDVRMGPISDGRSFFSCVSLWLSKDVYHAPNPGDWHNFLDFCYF